MKRLFILLFSVLFFSGVLPGADITALDGTVYKNAEVLNTMPDGILINFVGKNGFNTVKLLKFNDLPVSIQKKYGYNSKKAANFEKEHYEWLNKQQVVEKEKKAEQTAEQQQEELNAKIKQTDNASSKQPRQKEKLNGLVNKLDNMPGHGELDSLVHDDISSTKSQIKQIDNLTK